MRIPTDKVFKLFASCKLVRGHTRGVLFDLQRNRMYPIPLTLCELLEERQSESFGALLEHYGSENSVVLTEYFHFLIEEELIFFTDTPMQFPDLSDEWDHPYDITNMIIDLNFVDETLPLIVRCIGDVPVENIQVRIYKSAPLSAVVQLLESLVITGLSSLELVIPFHTSLDARTLQDLCNTFPYIFSIHLFSSRSNRHIKPRTSTFGHIKYVEGNIHSHHDCGIVLPEFFTINTKTYTESLNYNSCLNRKVSIDVKGNIKNCPAMTESFGNIYENTLTEAIGNKAFRKYWQVTKDMIAVCQDCEFRYVCTDCRAYVEDPSDTGSKPLKCGYDPYSGRWENWSSNPLKLQIMDSYLG